MKAQNSINDFAPEAVVIDAGSFPTNPIALQWLEGCERIVCCDGAANRYLADDRNRAWRIVGDCDSLSPEILHRYASIVRRNPDQETNDQTKAVSYLASKGITRIAILGATGLREDHTLGNISLIIDYLAMGIDARIFTDFGVFIPADGTRQFHIPMNAVWGYEYYGDTRVVDTLIKRLRQKLLKADVHFVVRSIYGVGYTIEETT